jgi:uncharacterized repeat protein (TIGR01451 family)
VRLRQAALAFAVAGLLWGTAYAAVGIHEVPPPSIAPAAARQPPAGLAPGVWEKIRSAIRRSEYHARPVEPGGTVALHAPNRRQGYGTTFKQDGIEIRATGSRASWRLGFSVAGYGYESDLRPAGPAAPEATKDRIEYRRDGMTEWYVNRPGGLEQGFEMLAPRVKRDEPLVIDMVVRGDLVARAEAGTAASFATASGDRVLRYSGLKAWDARGRTLHSRLEAAGRRLRLVVEARSARFPVTIDPVFVHEAQLFGHGDAIAPADAEFGSSVSVSGDTAVVGSPIDDVTASIGAGSVYVFVRSGTVWAEEQRLVAPDADDDDRFGSSVSISGETIVVGAPSASNSTGSAYVFVRSGSVWTMQQKVVAPDGGPNESFGHSVSVDGDTVVVGTPFQTFQLGAAYVFVRSGLVWNLQQKLAAPDGGANDRFGFAVSLSADTALVGAHQHNTAGGLQAGAAYVFVRTGTTWAYQQKLLAGDGAAGDLFGHSVSFALDTAVVGAPFDDNAGGTNAGSAYVFVRSGTFWSLQQKLLASDGVQLAQFGVSVSFSGDTAAVGASGDDLPAPNAGSAYVFQRSGITWSEQQKLVASDTATGDALGSSVSIFGDTVVAGARLDDVLGSLDAGSAYVFVRSGTTWSEQQRLTASVSGAAFELFGSSVSVFGDTAVIGAERDATSGGMDAGAAYVFVRSGAGWTEQQKLVASDGDAGSFFGASVSLSGDTLVVGAPLATAPGGSAGAAYVFVRSGTTWSEQQKLVASDGASGDFFGASLSISGDRAVVGAYRDATAGGFDAGSAYVFVRAGSTWSEQQKVVASDGAAFDNFGFSVSISGSTFVVGAFQDDNANGANAGSARVFVGSGGTWSEQQTLLSSDGAAADFFGYSVSIDGDTVLAGAYGDDTAGGANAGSAYVFVRSGLVWSEQQKVAASDGGQDDELGRAVAIFGDTALIGASFEDGGAPNAGAAYVFVRSGPTWGQHQKLQAPDGAATDLFGESVAVHGDTVVVGALSDDTPADGPDAGSAHVFRLQLQSDLVVDKTDGQTTAIPGQPLTYAITVSNGGPDPVTGATVTDVVPGALLGPTWTCVPSPGSTCASSGSGSIFDVVNLLVGGTATYALTGTVDPAATGSLLNTATVAPPAGFGDPNPANDSSADVDTLTPLADLALTKTASADPVAPGAPLSYELTVTNAGPSNAGSVTLIDTLPVGVTFLSSVPGPPACTLAGADLTCTLGPLPAGGAAAVTIDVIVNAAPGALVNTAIVSGSDTDPNPGNNSASVTTTVRGAKGELAHGTSAVHDLAALPGPLPDLDVFLIGQKPYSSYEVVVDGTSGDIGTGTGPLVQRIGPDGTTVLQDSVAVGTGPSRSLRWRNTAAADVDDETVRVRSAGCTTDCGADDVYRIRAYDTTCSVPRFNNAGSQVTVLVLQNPTNDPIAGEVYFRDTAGTLVAIEPFTLTAKETLLLNTAAVPGAGGVGGAITIAHDGRYGDLSGKTVALEPATGFSFDAVLEARPR